jgi:hypothetical protein
MENKCNRTSCNYLTHSDINNNGGTHCCKLCKIDGNHGSQCQRKHIRPSKIFVIGFNKTATLSFHSLFLKNKIKSIHTTDPVLPIIDKYEAFTDGKHNDFQMYYNKYPEGLFILNTRPLKKWLVSRYKHEIVKKPSARWFWPPSQEQTDSWIEEHNDHVKKVLDFFKIKPKSLLIINIERKGWEQKLLGFINKSNGYKVHENKRDDSIIEPNTLKHIYSVVETSLENKGYTGEELLYKDFDISQYDYDFYL